MDQRLHDIVARQPYPLVFATISGAHLYGFPSPDSDYDLRGAHVLPVQEVVGIRDARETIEIEDQISGLELDLVTHDIRKFVLMMLKRNGYVLEQLYSPLVVQSSPDHEELKEIAKYCLTKHHAHHYLGFVRTQWKLFRKENPPRIKPLLYVYRVLLTGIHLMRAGEVESNLSTLNESFALGYLDDLIAAKTQGPEQATIAEADLPFHEREYERLTAELEAAREVTDLPDAPTARDALHDFVVRVRTQR
jgi:predicted nucleotidyltransferase